MRSKKLSKASVILVIFLIVFVVLFLFPGGSAKAQISAAELEKLIQELQNQVLDLQKQVGKLSVQSSVTVVPVISGYNFDQDLFFGTQSEAVENLQEVLTQEGVYSGPVTGYFGELTKTGIIRFQEKYANEILKPVGLTQGTGFFGPSTRQKLNGILSAPLEPLSTTSPPPESALLFDGIKDFVDLGKDPSLNLSSNFEISFSVKLTAPLSSAFVARIDENGKYDKYWYIGGAGNRSGKIEASIGDGTKFSQIFSDVSINDSQWHNVVWKRNGDIQTITVDGVNRTKINYVDAGIGDVNPATNVYLGADLESNKFFFKGELGNVKIIVDGEVRWQQ